MDLLLDDDIYANNIEYFFSLHGLRFEQMNIMMAESLSKRYGAEFRPIRILNAWPAVNYDLPNYIILNQQGEKLSKELGKHVVYLPDYEDVNIEFCRNPEIMKIVQRLLAKQERIFIYPFTTSFLEPQLPELIVLGPNAELARNLDSKVNQTKLFMKLGLPHNRARIFETEEDLLRHENDIVPSYISAAFTSGGAESGLIYTPEMLRAFIARLRTVNKKNSFVVSDIFENIVLAPNASALVTSNGGVYTLMIADQILHGNQYLGNLYPSAASAKHLQTMQDIINVIGKYLADQGYRGLFGCDFLINNKDELVVVDLNPRHQGGYVCNGLALATKGLSLTDLELAVLNDEEVKLLQDELDKDLGFAWGHSKLIPSEKGQKILDEYSLGDIRLPFSTIGKSFGTEFYEKGSIFISGYIGYQVHTGQTRADVETRMIDVRTDFNSRVLGL